MISDYFKSHTIVEHQAGVRHEDGTVEDCELHIHVPSQFEYDLMEIIPWIVRAIGIGVFLAYIVWLNLHVGL